MYESRPRYQVIPPIVKNLIIINVLLAVMQHVLWGSFHISLADYLGLHYFRSKLFMPWQPLTHMFMHGDPRDVMATIPHLLFNMFALWMFGSILENRWGPKRFLIFYLICGLGAAACQIGVMSLQYEPVVDSYKMLVDNPTLAQFELFLKRHPMHSADPRLMERVQSVYYSWMQSPGDMSLPKFATQFTHEYIYGASDSAGMHVDGLVDEGMVGASGAVFGVLFAFAYLYPNLELYIFFIPIPIKAKWVVLAYGLFELYSGVRNSAGDNVAHFAHIGGMLFAFLLLRLWKYRFGDRHF